MLHIMIDSIISYVHDCYTGCNSSQPRKNKFLPIICTGAHCPEKSKNRQDISRKRGNAQKIWTPYTQMECNTRGSEGWRTPCPGKHGITSQIAVRKSVRSNNWKSCFSFRRKYMLFDFYCKATPITEGKYLIF